MLLFVWHFCESYENTKLRLNFISKNNRTHEVIHYIQIDTQLQYYVCQKAIKIRKTEMEKVLIIITYSLNIFSNVVNSNCYATVY